MSAIVSPIETPLTAPLPSTSGPASVPTSTPQEQKKQKKPLDRLEPKDRETILNRRLVRLDLRIRSQFDLISSRTGWLLTSHAFMLAAMGATLNANVAERMPTHDWMRTFLLWALPALGLLTSVLVWRSVLAAYRIVRGLKNARRRLLKICRREFEYELTGLRKADVRDGDLPPKVFPCALGFIWSVLLVMAILG